MPDLIHIKNFIQSTRDSGYKNVATAISELIDNSIEAGATRISLEIKKTKGKQIILMLDNGKGMNYKEIQKALQFGGSTRFNSRESYGRYGMGLPNSSLSIARRVEVFSWKNKNDVFWTYLDIDEIIDGSFKQLRKPKSRQIDCANKSHSGTVIVWKNIDRLGYKSIKPLEKFLKRKLGQTYRHFLYNGFKILINDLILIPFDPLFLLKGQNFVGSISYGKDIELELKVPNRGITKNITIRFSILPIEKWSLISNQEKSKNSITKKAGISILRNGREIDYGWFFMGKKRRENYDDWWRGEIAFPAEFDELFGVTHTKQFINPTQELKDILSNHIEPVARSLHRQVIDRFIAMKKGEIISDAVKLAMNKDAYLTPLKTKRKKLVKIPESGRGIPGMKYSLLFRESTDQALFKPILEDETIKTIINSNHAFYRYLENELIGQNKMLKSFVSKLFELIILAAARAELVFEKASSEIETFRIEWGRVLTKFLT